MTNFNSKDKTCCFTGHREIDVKEKKVKQAATACIVEAIERGYTHFVAGGAYGFDMLAAEVIVRLKKHFDIVLEIALPFPEHSRSWKAKQKWRLAKILKRADKCTVVCSEYCCGCYQTRNEYMVDSSSYVIAYFANSNGGTKNTLAYARAKQIDVTNIAEKLLTEKTLAVNEHYAKFEERMRIVLSEIPVNERGYKMIMDAVEQRAQRIDSQLQAEKDKKGKQR